MKRILYLILLVSVVGCTYNSPPEELAPYYMYKLSEAPGWSASNDLLKIDIDGYHYEKDYVPSNTNSLILPSFNIQDAYRGYKNISAVYTNFPTQINGDEIPNAPFKVGDDWDFNDSTNLPITGVYMTGFWVTIALPKPFEENLRYGYYKLMTNRLVSGVKIANQWTIKSIDSFGNELFRNYLIEMQPIGNHKIEVLGIDSSNAKEIRVTAAFDGKFKAIDSFEQKLGRNSEIDARGSFSFVINQ